MANPNLFLVTSFIFNHQKNHKLSILILTFASLCLKSSLLSTRMTSSSPSMLRISLHFLHLPLLPKLPPSTASRRIDDNPLPSFHSSRVLPAQIDPPFLPHNLLVLSISVSISILPIRIPIQQPIRSLRVAGLDLPHPDVQPTLGILATLQPIWPIHPPLAQDGRLDGDAEFDIADDAIAAVPLAAPAAALAQRELAQQHGIPALEHLGVGDARVRHVRVHAAGASPSVARAAAARDRLVVSEPLHAFAAIHVAPEPERQVVAVALRRRAGMERPEDHVRHSLRREHVATDHGGFVARREEGRWRDEYRDGLETALV